MNNQMLSEFSISSCANQNKIYQDTNLFDACKQFNAQFPNDTIISAYNYSIIKIEADMIIQDLKGKTFNEVFQF